MSYLFIINPIAGKNKGAKILPIIKEVLDKRKVAYELIETTKAGEAEKIAKEAVSKKHAVIVAVGGDGTIHEVLNGMIGSNKALGIIPAGTGNDLSRTLKLPENPESALELILEGKTKKIDLGKIGEKHFINFASVGLDAVIASEANNIKRWIAGKGAYILAALKGISTFKSRKVQFVIDDKIMLEEVMMITVCNGVFYGGGMKVAPEADLEDGLFDVYVIKAMNKLKLLLLFPTIYMGKHVKYQEVSFYRAKTVTIFSDKQIQINADGEIIENKPLVFEILHRSLEIIIG
ncbi:lipid kinase, YegS/Rv2252/BmrU family [Natronincola peptidivorans]|uniref:Lipid kinase, YegS/Rv2252/BmrU family n=1 Tax=Natronincola peptidivorans TaxID=426128 RepID=A0A1I0GP72_9FIRM|nr:diacylglycerol kinase family protein [Natronincola peptidivorans]SET71951.1 lipid kinase, YegS/Rv2252/BmrU family [Natronincola peptidivorans]